MLRPANRLVTLHILLLRLVIVEWRVRVTLRRAYLTLLVGDVLPALLILRDVLLALLPTRKRLELPLVRVLVLVPEILVVEWALAGRRTTCSTCLRLIESYWNLGACNICPWEGGW